MMDASSVNPGHSAGSNEQRDGLLKKIFGQLSDKTTKEVVLCGEPGVGKTWIAKKLSERATRDESAGSFQFTIWIYLCRKYTGNELCESIARQLSLILTEEDFETMQDDMKDKKTENEKGKKNENEKDNMKTKEEEEKMWKELKEKISQMLEKKRFLLILDGEGSMKMEEEETILAKMKELLPLDQEGTHTILKTTRDESSDGIPVKPLSNEGSLSLLEKKMGRKLDDSPEIKSLATDFLNLKRCNGFPAKIILLAKALNYFENQDSGIQTLRKALEEASGDENYDVLRLLRCGNLIPLNVLVDCCWGGSHFFREHRSVHCNELITYWMLEGYLGHIDSIEKAYETGHNLLMDLIDYQVIKELEAGYVIMNPLELDLYDPPLPGFGTTASLGLATIFESESEGFGRIIYGDGIMKTISKDKDGHFFSALLLDGNQHSEDVLSSPSFLQSKKKLEVLALFNSTIESLSVLLSDMKNLRVLVLRGCDINSRDIKSFDLPNLTVLEISGPSSVESLPELFFKHMTSLRVLNLSKLQIKFLPSISHLTGMRWLILRMCSNLESLDSVAALTNLMVLDLSDATSLKVIKDKHFLTKEKLHTVNLSNTSIQTLPLIKGLVNLTHLFIRGCTVLDRLRGMSTLKKLQVLRLSNSSKFTEFHDQSLGVLESLKILDLSGCSLDHLPANIGNPHYLYLRGCPRLKNLLSMEALKSLKELDVSGSRELAEIGDEFFDKLTDLQKLNLTETNVKSLPSLSGLAKVRELLISRCPSLQKLEGLNSLKNIEVIDLSYCTSLKEMEDNSFDNMSCLLRLDLSNTMIESLPPLPDSMKLRHLILKNCSQLKSLSLPSTLLELEELNLHGVGLSGKPEFVEGMRNLRILDLSNTKLEILPSMLNLSNLSHLCLGGCRLLKEVPELDRLTNLEVLDLSGTAVSQLESIQHLQNLRSLLLRDCSSIQGFPQLQMATLVGPTIAKLPSEFSGLTRLELLDLPRRNENQGSETTENLQDSQNQQQWTVSSWPNVVKADDDKHVLSVSETHFLDLFKQTSFMQYHFLVRPIDQSITRGFEHFYKDELILRHIWFEIRQFAHPQRSLEIRGFCSYPVGVDPVLGHAEYLFLVDNSFIKWLSDADVSSVKEVKGCWIERCIELERFEKIDVVKTEAPVEKVSDSGDKLRTLWTSSSSTFKSTNDGGILIGNIFNNLKFFYLDNCPKLAVCFSASQKLENLELLEVKCCSELVTLFENESATLPKLRMLHLWALPKLVKVDYKVPALCRLKVGECPMLETLFSSSNIPENVEKEISECPKLDKLQPSVDADDAVQ